MSGKLLKMSFSQMHYLSLAGDRLLAVDGHCLLNRRYDEALRLMRASGEEVELVLSQATHASSDENLDLPPTSYQNGCV